MASGANRHADKDGDRAVKDRNHTILQAFEWYTPGGGNHWRWLHDNADRFAAMGLTALWLPPPTKAAGDESTGYDMYDLWDLGEFVKGGKEDGHTRTKYGTREELEALMKKLREVGISIYIDAVLNHKDGAEETEVFAAHPVDEHQRNKDIGPQEDIEAWTKFTFPGRKGKYSDFTWCFNHFTGVDWNQKTQKKQIYRIEGCGKKWAKDVMSGDGVDNFDYLMCADVDHSHPDVEKDLIAWGKWMLRTFPISGFRFDAVKHMSRSFVAKFIGAVREEARSIAKERSLEIDESEGPICFAVGEEWTPDIGTLNEWLGRFGEEQFSLFDVPLHYKFKAAGDAGDQYDLRGLLDNTLLTSRPMDAVTFVENHDTQAGQALESTVSPTFKPLAYATILLRPDGYPCVFLGDLDGCHGEGDSQPSVQPMSSLDRFVLARSRFSYGELRDYRDHPSCVGWVRMGTEDKDFKNSLAVVMSVGSEGFKRMEVGSHHKGKEFVDLLGWHEGAITIGDDGWAEFKCSGQSVSIWVLKEEKEALDKGAKSS